MEKEMTWSEKFVGAVFGILIMLFIGWMLTGFRLP